jgi:phenylacetate-coenzyme A ligase PaaK-like adenylate-forming protein
LFSATELTLLKAAGMSMWIPFGANIEPHLSDAFAHLSIPVRANYSSEEVGMIGAECPKRPGYYHVATSNAIVEVVDQSYDLQGATVGKVLVTHLHSYATPFIRYDLGDLACLSERCPCGHDGPAIHNLQGRISSVIKHRDGRLSPFMVHGRGLAALVDFAEFRIRQTAFEKIVVEIGGRSELGCDQIARIDAFLRDFVGSDFSIEIRTRPEIDWGESQKRPGFICEI